MAPSAAADAAPPICTRIWLAIIIFGVLLLLQMIPRPKTLSYNTTSARVRDTYGGQDAAVTQRNSHPALWHWRTTFFASAVLVPAKDIADIQETVYCYGLKAFSARSSHAAHLWNLVHLRAVAARWLRNCWSIAFERPWARGQHQHSASWHLALGTTPEQTAGPHVRCCRARTANPDLCSTIRPLGTWQCIRPVFRISACNSSNDPKGRRWRDRSRSPLRRTCSGPKLITPFCSM